MKRTHLVTDHVPLLIVLVTLQNFHFVRWQIHSILQKTNYADFTIKTVKSLLHHNKVLTLLCYVIIHSLYSNYK